MVSDKIKGHLKKLVKTAQLPDTENSVELMVAGFVDKLECYDNLVKENNLIDTDILKNDESCGALVITYSGSLLSIGPRDHGVRKVEYASIGIRKDVPEIASEDFSEINGDIKVDSAVSFIIGPIQNSSGIYRIAKVSKMLDYKKQEELLSDVTRILVDDFVEVNNTVIS